MKIQNPKLPQQEGLANPVSPHIRTRKRRLGGLVQSLVAVLVVCALLAGFVALFASRHPTPKGPGPSTGGHHTPTPVMTTPAYIVAALSTHGTLYALRPDTGAVLWHFATGRVDANAQMDAIVTIQDHVVYFDVLGQVYALQAGNGHLLWHRDLGITHPATYDGSGGSLFLDHDMVYVSGFGDAEGIVYALRARDGAVLWHTQAGWLVLLTESNGILYLDDQNANGGYGDLKAVRGSDGKTLWSYNTAPITAVVDNGILYVHSANVNTPGSNKEQKTIIALRAQDGKFIWSVPAIDFGANALVVENGVILLNTTVHFCAFRSSDGAQLWCTRNDLPPEAANVTAYAAMNGTLYASYPTQTSTNSNNPFVRMEAINLNDGTFRWSRDFSNTFNSGSLAVMDGSVYTAVNGTVFSLNGKNGHELWQTLQNLESLVTVVAGLL
jgi:outer membrane protein assembly factor BamB